ncbi:hypothetical protein KOR42_35130 [Thalassoglobus neptunius]|uniref:Uncharacterized protein n=1 Tax=Thalassoglobus neptunius TaxID=1938619 RepID=A0A5C5WN64_9PLAN|nr:hypothetical protein KOR42_35130 [Thalassoglobus neptunius]
MFDECGERFFIASLHSLELYCSDECCVCPCESLQARIEIALVGHGWDFDVKDILLIGFDSQV